MGHADYKRIVAGADTAVLFIHGILGTPNHFRELIPLEQLVPEDYSVYNILLDGHGGNVDDFSNSSMTLWRRQVKNAFLELARTHDWVVIATHSMGTLFAIQLGIEFSEKIPFLFLLGVPLRPWMRFSMARDCLRMAFGKLPDGSVLHKATGISPSPKIWKYIRWIPRYLELFREIALTERMIKGLKIPCTAYQSGRDELVANLTTGILKKMGVMSVHHLPNSTHFSYTESDAEQVCADFVRQLKEKSHD